MTKMFVARPYRAVRVQFAHAHEAGIREGHGEIGVFAHETKQIVPMLFWGKVHANSTPPPKGAELFGTTDCILKQMHGLRYDCLAGNKSFMQFCIPCRGPPMVLIAWIAQGHQWTSICEQDPHLP